MSNNFDEYDEDHDDCLSFDEYKRYSKVTILEIHNAVCWVVFFLFLNVCIFLFFSENTYMFKKNLLLI